ncbi:MAG TPA: hypothetical protein VGJ39_08465 [Vicinamibacterales bacterium]
MAPSLLPPCLVRTVFLAWVLLAAALLGLGGLFQASHSTDSADGIRTVRVQTR